MSDDYIYEVLLIDKPDDYEQQKAEIKAQEEANRKLQQEMANQMEKPQDTEPKRKSDRRMNMDNESKAWYERARTDFRNWLCDFFGVALKKKDGALPF